MTATPLRVVLVGIGGMGRAWLRTIQSSSDVELVGIVDIDLARATSVAAEAGLDGIALAADLSALPTETRPDAVVNVTVPAAHLPVSLQAFRLGLPVLSEKPAAATLAEALTLLAGARTYDRLLMISQSRRYNVHLAQAKALLPRIGRIGIVSTEFFKAPHFGGFRDQMEHPLLLDMAIHPFDTARYLLDDDPVSVYCDEYNPSWSWYKGDAAATAIFEMSGGRRFTYSASWCSPGLETSWNGSWLISGEHGSVRWDGDNSPTVETESTVDAAPTVDPGEGISGSLAEFCGALRTNTVPMGEIRENLMSLAMVEAAVLSARQRQRITIDDVLATAHQEATDNAPAELADVLRSWGSVRDIVRP